MEALCQTKSCRNWDKDYSHNCLKTINPNSCENTELIQTFKDKPSNPRKRGKILEQAHKVINGERQDTYGSPEDSFALIGEYWTSYLLAQGHITKAAANDFISPREVAEMMMLFKIARMSGQKPKTDNYVDLAGYAGIAADMVEG